MTAATEQLQAYVEYLRDLGVYDFYRQGGPLPAEALAALMLEFAPASANAAPGLPPQPVTSVRPERVRDVLPAQKVPARPLPFALDTSAETAFTPAKPSAASFLEVPVPKPVSFDELVPLPQERVAPTDKASALTAIQNLIGDCTRCPLAYAGRRKIVFGDGDSNARLMFVGEGPGADEDASGIPFVGKAGQLLNNMISAMGLKREEVYIANIVKCRPPANRTPEPVEANTCSPFLLEQIDTIQPQVIVALGGTAATYLLGVKQSLGSLRGSWHSCRGAKVAVTYHPAYLLRDPSQKGEAWKDLQRVMAELGLKRQA